MNNRVTSKHKQHFSKHKYCYILIGFFLFIFSQMIAVHIITPIRCNIWKGKEVDVFLTPEEWRALSGVSESLKDTEWIYYPTIEGEPEKDPFFITHQGLYQPVMYFNGNRHSLSTVNNEHPYLNLYSYINPTKILGHNTFILYDQKLKRIIVQYNTISGYYMNNFFSGRFSCNENSISESIDFLKNYLH